MDQAKAHFNLFGDSFDFSTRKVHSLRQMYHGHGNHFGYTRWYSCVMHVKWRLVCTECTTAWKPFWAHPMVLPGDVSQVEARFGPFGGSVNLDAR
jgi:hypothetical protein